MRPKYLSIVWPFLAVLVTYCCGSNTKLLAAVFSVFLVFGLEQSTQGMRWAGAANDRVLRQADHVVIDIAHIGIVPRLAFYMRDDQWVFAADQQALLDPTSEWQRRLKDGALLLATRAYGNTLDAEDRLVGMLREDWVVRDLGAGVNGTGRLYRLNEKPK